MKMIAALLCIPVVLGSQSPEQLFTTGRLDEARSAFQTSLARNKNDANAMFFLGRIARLQGRAGEAVDWFEKAARIDERNAVYHVWLGSALGDEAQQASKVRQPFLARKVKAAFERAVELDPTLIDARQGLVDFYSVAPGVMGGSMEKAKHQADEILKLNAARGHLAHARLAARQKDAPGEEQSLKRAAAAAPDSAAPLYSLGAFYRRHSRWDEAFAVFDQLMKIAPDDIVAHAVWGFTAAQSGQRLERGERELNHFLVNRRPDTPYQTVSGAHFRLGQIYERTGRREQARAVYAEAVRVNPHNRDAKAALDALK